MNPRRRHPRRRGLTLLECLFATLILSFCAVSVTEAVLAAYQQRAAGTQRQAATELAEQLAGIVAAYDYVDDSTMATRVSNVMAVQRGLLSVTNANQFDGYTDTIADSHGNDYDRHVSVRRDATLNNAPIVEVTVASPSGETSVVRRMLLEGTA